MLTAFGRIENPLDNWRSYGSLTDDVTGPMSLLSNIFLLLATAAGIFALINLIISGIQYVSSQGDPKATSQALNRITMSLIGLAIIAGSFVIAAIIGRLLFGESDFIFTPEIYGPGADYL